MTIRMNVKSQMNGSAPARTSIVPPASVFEPGVPNFLPAHGSRVRTLDAHPRTTERNVRSVAQRRPARSTREMRQERRRTYLLGAVLGIATVIGSVVAMGDDVSAPQSSVGDGQVITAVTK